MDCYAGYRGDERPQRFVLAGRVFEVECVEDQWYSPGAIYFRVVMKDGNHYVLRHDEVQDQWTLEAFRATRERPVAGSGADGAESF
ncbi:MAG TPA: hypothetical protein VOA41_19575 [Candidatus Dormibacteraeota bacterium]|nr:hypothetical protein [Candidatus Dormibacteraeota bacterium]